VVALDFQAGEADGFSERQQGFIHTHTHYSELTRNQREKKWPVPALAASCDSSEWCTGMRVRRGARFTDARLDRGREFPLMLESRLKCPRWSSRRARVAFRRACDARERNWKNRCPTRRRPGTALVFCTGTGEERPIAD
jgi:hypothetical protein